MVAEEAIKDRAHVGSDGAPTDVVLEGDRRVSVTELVASCIE